MAIGAAKFNMFWSWVTEMERKGLASGAVWKPMLGSLGSPCRATVVMMQMQVHARTGWEIAAREDLVMTRDRRGDDGEDGSGHGSEGDDEQIVGG